MSLIICLQKGAGADVDNDDNADDVNDMITMMNVDLMINTMMINMMLMNLKTGDRSKLPTTQQ